MPMNVRLLVVVVGLDDGGSDDGNRKRYEYISTPATTVLPLHAPKFSEFLSKSTFRKVVWTICGGSVKIMETAVEHSLTAAQKAKLHGVMCSKLALLVKKLAEPLPALNAERHRWPKSGIEALYSLELALDKSRVLLQYCANSSKLYLAIKGQLIVSKFEALRDELGERVRRLSILVPQSLALQMAELETEVVKTEFYLDLEEKLMGSDLISLVLQKRKGGQFENPLVEQEIFLQIGTRLGLTSPEGLNLERQALEKQLENARGKQDRKKESTIVHILYLIKKYNNVLLLLHSVGRPNPALSALHSFNRLSSWSGSTIASSGSANSVDNDIKSHCSGFDIETDATSNTSYSSKLPLAPEEFRCPISLQLMSDPVIVASGQTYERVCIEKWFREGHVTCPKTQQRLEHLSITPNYCVKGLIAGWCEAHGLPVPEPPSTLPTPVVSTRFDCSGSESGRKGRDYVESAKLKGSGSSYDFLSMERKPSGTEQTSSPSPLHSMTSSIDFQETRWASYRSLSSPLCNSTNGWLDEKDARSEEITEELSQVVENLLSRSWDVRCRAAEQIRLYTKNSSEARLIIGDMGAIPSLVELLQTAMDLDDIRAQESCALALLNVAVNNDRNKGLVVNAEAVPLLVKMMRVGETQAVKESAAAALLTLSCLRDNKGRIGSSGVIPLLVQMIISGSSQGRRDALTTLYNLTIFVENRLRVIRAGALPILFHLLSLRKIDLIEKCIALLYNLSFTEEGRNGIARTEDAISILADILETGSVKEKEHVAATMLLLCTNSSQLNDAVLNEGVIPSLVATSVSGTPRARDKAQKLLQHFREQRQKEAPFHKSVHFNVSTSPPTKIKDVTEQSHSDGEADSVRVRDSKETDEDRPSSSFIYERARRLTKSRSFIFNIGFSCRPRMCSLRN
ncbi:hypothetical protein R1flu_004667 [Riccia fluitans]|uniref:RING-type E3 ubiquitin transferase n=1 Tax=Riccia fluitans TaxID=41844 RepID=A0ABD1YRK8_9MARC